MTKLGAPAAHPTKQERRSEGNHSNHRPLGSRSGRAGGLGVSPAADWEMAIRRLQGCSCDCADCAMAHAADGGPQHARRADGAGAGPGGGGGGGHLLGPLKSPFTLLCYAGVHLHALGTSHPLLMRGQ